MLLRTFIIAQVMHSLRERIRGLVSAPYPLYHVLSIPQILLDEQHYFFISDECVPVLHMTLSHVLSYSKITKRD